MTLQERATATPAGVVLCRLDDLADPGARNFVLEIKDRRFHGFVVRKGDRVHGYVDRCPHNGTPLAVFPDRYLTRERDLLLCGTHGALFRVGDGRCVAGPCEGRALTPWPVTVEGESVVTA